MSVNIETLESRTLMSATTLAADQATLTSDITALPGYASADYDTVGADLSGATITKADKAIATKWVAGIKSKYNALLKANTAGDSTINKDVTKFNASTGTKQTAAGTKLDKDAAKALATITKDTNALQAAYVSGVQKIAAANSSNTQLQADATTIESNINARAATLLSDATVAFSTDTTAITTA